MATTFELIRRRQVSLLEAIVPLKLSGQRFRAHTDSTPFMDFVEKSPKGSFRRFEILDNFDDESTGTTDGAIEGCQHTFELRVAYPTTDSDRAMEDLIRSDRRQIDATIGLNGGLGYVDGQYLSQIQGHSIGSTAGARILSMTFLVQYDRSV
jgi:hypothetical protein